MLNKKLEYKNIIMEIDSNDIPYIKEPVLPNGFEFCFFQDGMQDDWARIETSVLEFDDEQAAKEYFERDYLMFSQQLCERCIFIKNENGEAIATATAWYSDTQEFGHQAALHWVAVQPKYQGLGLGKAIIQKVTRQFLLTDPGCDVILHTQTWSDRAVLCYMDLGYRFSKTKKLALAQEGGSQIKILENDFEQAIEVLKPVVSVDYYERMKTTAR